MSKPGSQHSQWQEGLEVITARQPCTHSGPLPMTELAWNYSTQKPVSDCIYQDARTAGVPVSSSSMYRYLGKFQVDDGFEDVPEDEISEDEEANCAYTLASTCLEDDVTERLLKFAETVNKDIHKYFGVKDDGTSCDIYEEKWSSGKSGRELYYAELLKVAQGIDVSESSSHDKPQNNAAKKSKETSTHTAGRFNGNSDSLGPLEELFKVGRGSSDTDVKQESVNRKKNGLDNVKVPLAKRNLPPSFWIEPNITQPNLKRLKESIQ